MSCRPKLAGYGKGIIINMNDKSMILETDRLRIYCLEVEDMLLLNQGSKEEQYEKLRGYSIGRLAELDKELIREFSFLASENENSSSLWFRLWDITLTDGNKKIGGALFKGGPDKNGEVEIGYGINDEFQGRGYAAEAVKKLVQWALEQKGVLSVKAETEKDNIASQKVLQHIGMYMYAETETDYLWRYRPAIKTGKPADSSVDLVIQPIDKQQIPLLEKFFYLAIFQQEEEKPLPGEIIYEPANRIYFEQWGKPDDNCLIAEKDGRVVGMVFTRLLNEKPRGYGNIDNSTPEFAISVLKEYRNQGIGTALMNSMLQLLKEKGYLKASLAVQKDNYALKMYEAAGFQIINENEQEYIMVCDLGLQLTK